MRIAQWLNTARIMGILYAIFVLSIGSLVYAESRNMVDSWDLFITGTKMAVWLLFQCAMAGVMIEAWRQHRTSGTISRRIAKVMYWAPRTVWMLIILFLAVNGTSFFRHGSFKIDNIWSEFPTLAFFLGPSIILGVILAAAWRWESVGAAVIVMLIIFLLLQFSYYSFTETLEQFLLIMVPFVLLATAFWLNSCWHEEIRTALRYERMPLEQPAG